MATASDPFAEASISSLAPFTVTIGAKSAGGAWKVTTGSTVSVMAMGQFT